MASQEPGPSKQPFQTDVRRTRGLQAGQILLGRRINTTSAYDQDDSAGASSSSRDLKEEEERLNKRIDDSVKSLESGLVDLIQMFRVGDKPVARAEQERFTAEYRADQVVRATSSLAALGRALQLSLLLSQANEGQGSEGEERKRLREEMDDYKKKCGVLLGQVFDVGDGLNELPQEVPLDVGARSDDIASILAATAAAAAEGDAQMAAMAALPGAGLSFGGEGLQGLAGGVAGGDAQTAGGNGSVAGMGMRGGGNGSQEAPISIDDDGGGGGAVSTGQVSREPAQHAAGGGGEIQAVGDGDDEDMEEVI